MTHFKAYGFQNHEFQISTMNNIAFTKKSLRRVGCYHWVLVLGICIQLGYPLSSQAAEGSGEEDFQLSLRALTDKVRAYDLRLKAMNQLVLTEPTRTFPILVDLVKDSQDVESLRYEAAQMMVQINSLESANVFNEIFADRRENSFARRISISQLTAMDEPRVKQKINDILEDEREDPAIRQYALGVFGKMNQPGKISKLRGFVNSKVETLSLRNNSLFILESLGDKEFVALAIESILKNRTDPEELRKNSLVMSERMGNEEFLPLITAIALNSQESSSIRQLALSILSRKGDSKILNNLQDALSQSHSQSMRVALKETMEAIRAREQSTQHSLKTEL